jgi:hypothetical protein
MRIRKVPGSAVALGRCRVRPRARLVETTTGLRPHSFQLSPRGRVLVHPRAGALPETMALSRHFVVWAFEFSKRHPSMQRRTRDPHVPTSATTQL